MRMSIKPTTTRPKTISMLKFFVSLFKPIDEELPILEPQPLCLKLNTSDPFGATLENYNNNLSTQKRLVANKLLAQLMKIGSAARSPKDWVWLRHFVSASFSNQDLYDLNAHWWAILQKQVKPFTPSSQLKQNIHEKCAISKTNISAARGVLWLNIYLLKANSIPGVLNFVSACQDNYPNCPESSMKLAFAGVDMLVGEPYFKSWRREIAYTYPNLLRGKVAKRLEMAWARKAS